MNSPFVSKLYHRYGPILFSHFLRRLGDENRAMKATRYAFDELLKAGRTAEEEVVPWIRGLDTPRQVAQTDSLY